MPASLLRHLWLTAPAQVSHVKNKWKCLLRNGVLTLNGTEYVFNSATGTFTF
jgi:transcription initiation factor TFIIA large subunit